MDAGVTIASPITEPVATLTRVEDLSHRLEGKLSQTSSPAAYAQLSGQLRQSLELVARLRRELDERPQVAVLIAPEWLAVRSTILRALTGYPEARRAVVDALNALDGATETTPMLT